MDTSVWLSLQALGTMAVVIALALWSWRRTKRMREEGRPRAPSALARDKADPKFHPDAEETDPHHVTKSHPHEPDHRADKEPLDEDAGDRKDAKTDRRR